MRRRRVLGLLGSAGAALAAAPTRALAEAKPLCTETERISERRSGHIDVADHEFGGSWRIKLLPETQWYGGDQYAVDPSDPAGAATLILRGGRSTIDHIEINFAMPPDRFAAGTNFLEVYSESNAEFRFDGVKRLELDRLSGTTRNFFDPPSWLVEDLAGSRSLRIDIFRKGEHLSVLEFDLTNLGDDMRYVDEWLSMQAYKAKNAGGCASAPDAVSPCVMTTATVEMLGRPDDGFELTAMRRLRARFGDETQVLADYVATSRALLARPRDLSFRLALTAFYGLVVLPTAALVRVGAWRTARGTYLGGFAALKAVLGHGPPDRS